MTVKFNTKATTNIWKKWFGKQIELLKFWNKIVCFMRHSEKVGDRTSGTTRTSRTFRTLWTSRASVTPRTTGSLGPLGPSYPPRDTQDPCTAWKVPKYRPKITSYLDTLYAVLGEVSFDKSKNFQTGLKLEFIQNFYRNMKWVISFNQFIWCWR